MRVNMKEKPSFCCNSSFEQRSKGYMSVIKNAEQQLWTDCSFAVVVLPYVCGRVEAPPVAVAVWRKGGGCHLPCPP